MKNAIRLLIMGIGFSAMFCSCSYFENHYTKTAIVYEVGENTITFDDGRYLWMACTDGEEELKIGDTVKMTLNANYTVDNVKDDKLENYKKI